MVALFLFGLFVTLMVGAACGLIVYGIYIDKKGRQG
jgi:hypothetical protein